MTTTASTIPAMISTDAIILNAVNVYDRSGIAGQYAIDSLMGGLAEAYPGIFSSYIRALCAADLYTCQSEDCPTCS